MRLLSRDHLLGISVPVLVGAWLFLEHLECAHPRSDQLHVMVQPVSQLREVRGWGAGRRWAEVHGHGVSIRVHTHALRYFKEH